MSISLKDKILKILKTQDAGIGEHQLHQLLETHPDMVKINNRNKLSLFQRHFIVMNALYQLQTEIRGRENLILDITALNIRLRSQPINNRNTREQPAEISKQPMLAAWYLDWDNFYKATENNVQRLIDQFWQMYANTENCNAAWKLLGLSAASSPAQIKARYYQLALKHHPDQGGDPIDFQQIKEAVNTLIGKFQ